MSPEHKKGFSFVPRKREELRLLGGCPACNTKDSIVEYPGSSFEEVFRARCEGCATVWPNWRRLVREQEQGGHRLIPVEIERMGEYGGLRVVLPENIPHRNLTTSVFNAALIARFNLGVCFAAEGGVTGIYKGSYIGLINDDNLGLWNEEQIGERGVVEVLDFYQELVGLLLEKEFQVGKRYYRRGEILRLPESKQTAEKAWEILTAILVKVRDRKFAWNVVRKLVRDSADQLGVLHLRGLTDEEIMERFVPPPLRLINRRRV